MPNDSKLYYSVNVGIIRISSRLRLYSHQTKETEGGMGTAVGFLEKIFRKNERFKVGYYFGRVVVGSSSSVDLLLVGDDMSVT